MINNFIQSNLLVAKNYSNSIRRINKELFFCNSLGLDNMTNITAHLKGIECFNSNKRNKTNYQSVFDEDAKRIELVAEEFSLTDDNISKTINNVGE